MAVRMRESKEEKEMSCFFGHEVSFTGFMSARPREP